MATTTLDYILAHLISAQDELLWSRRPSSVIVRRPSTPLNDFSSETLEQFSSDCVEPSVKRGLKFVQMVTVRQSHIWVEH